MIRTLNICSLVLALAAAMASAEAQELPVEDPQLKQCLSQLAAKNQWSSATEFTEITCHNKDIKSLKGIEKFPNLVKLSLYKNNLTEVNLSGLKQLKHLNVAKNALLQVKLDELGGLSELYLFNNRLQQLTLDNMPHLKQIKANSNQLTAVTFSQLSSLKKLYLFDNELEHIDIDTLPALKYMDVRQNPMPDELYDHLDAQSGLTALHDGNSEDWH